MPPPHRAEALSDDERLTSDVCLSRTSGLSREQRPRTRIPVSRSKVKGQGHQAALVGCSSHYITYLDTTSLYATAQSHHLHGAGAYCGRLLHCSLLCVICVFCLLGDLRLSVPVQVIDWKDSSPK